VTNDGIEMRMIVALGFVGFFVAWIAGAVVYSIYRSIRK